MLGGQSPPATASPELCLSKDALNEIGCCPSHLGSFFDSQIALPLVATSDSCCLVATCVAEPSSMVVDYPASAVTH